MVGMKKGLLILLLVAIAIVGCATNEQPHVPAGQGAKYGKGTGGQGGPGQGMRGNGSVNVQTLWDEIKTVKTGTLTEQEKEDILHMREEEKLARDVYLTLYNKWHLRIFQNIARSEQTHMDAIKLLIEKYGLKDPVEGKGIGEFSNPKFKELYDKLVAEGSKSVLDALKVGAMIEELDIVDLQNCLNHTNKTDIRLVYENLMKGSRNHLRAFVSTIERMGGTYEPHYLSKEEFEKIVGSEMERGPAT